MFDEEGAAWEPLTHVVGDRQEIAAKFVKHGGPGLASTKYSICISKRNPVGSVVERHCHGERDILSKQGTTF